jgi:acyl-CoA thioester hydrolase
MRTLEYHDTTVRVRYAETDQMGVVYHANYLIWFEVGRVELMRAMGFEYRTMETEDDCHIVVAEAHCHYEKPARYDEVVRVRTRIAEWRTRIVKFNYEIFRDGREEVHSQRFKVENKTGARSSAVLLATGFTTHVICGSNGRPKALPPKYRDVLVHLNIPNSDGSEV